MRYVAVLAVLLVSAPVSARPPPPDDYVEPTSWRRDRAFLEWSTWLRLGFGVERVPAGAIARSTQPAPSPEQRTLWDPAVGIDVTLPVPAPALRMGPWLELRPQGWFAGGEVSLAGRDLDMFWYEGERVYTVRAGSSMTHVTGAFAVGYRCPWRLWGPYSDASRYMIGVRLVASATRAVADPDDWSMSFGIEFEPVGALRYVGGIRSWY